MDSGMIVVALRDPHEVGSVCGPNCTQCAKPEKILRLNVGVEIPLPPLYLAKAATFEEYRQNCIDLYGNDEYCCNAIGCHFFWASSD